MLTLMHLSAHAVTSNIVMQDILRLYAFSLLLQLVIMIPYIIRAHHFAQSTGQIVQKVLDMLVHAAPPAIPAVMVLCGLSVTLRLRRQGINLMFQEVLMSAGGTEVVCFDKTGTLTGAAVRLCTSLSM